MSLKKNAVMILGLWCAALVNAQQSTPYILTDFPKIALGADTAFWIKWTGLNRNQLIAQPDSGRIYFSKSPGGSVKKNYTDSVTVAFNDTTIKPGRDSLQNNIFFAGTIPQRGIRFKPKQQPNMGPGVYYYIVAWKVRVGLKDTTFVSNELFLIIESDKAPEPLAPVKGAEIDNLTPTFTWKTNPGVPYYHVIVSNKEIIANLGDSVSVDGLSVVWQAITPNTQITYGMPDPSGTITADPPPMSPGKTYSWVVLNNYGNNIVTTSTKFALPEAFKIKGLPLKAPAPISPPAGDTINGVADSVVAFKWMNIDNAANSYQVYIYVGAEYQGQTAQMLVWKGEVSANGITGDTASMSVNVKSILTNNLYTWNVMAVDDRGGGTAGAEATFRYEGIPMGKLEVKTTEKITVGSSILENSVSLVQIQSEVLEGSMEAPLAFYTDNEGDLSRDRPAGRYRLTLSKNGFESTVRTVTVTKDATTNLTVYLKRPDATVYGKVKDKEGVGIDLAKIYGVSDRNDTVKTESNSSGDFVLNCIEGDWDIWAQKEGYITAVERDTSVTYGQSVNFGTITVVKNPNILSGVVANTSGAPILGVNVKLKKGSTVIGEVASTPQQGTFSFAVESGTYTLIANKFGFLQQEKVVEVTSSKQVTMEMSPGAVTISGNVYGATWGATSKSYAPIKKAAIMLIDSSVTPPKIYQSISNEFYGNYELSVAINKTYTMFSSAQGYIAHTRSQKVSTVASLPQTIMDTLSGYAVLQGMTMDTLGTTPIGDISVVLIDTLTGNQIGTTRSDLGGVYEIRNILNGIYRVQAGKSGFVTRSILLIDSAKVRIAGNIVEVNDGRVVKSDVGLRVIKSVEIRLEPGSKSITWRASFNRNPLTAAMVKTSSPLQTSLPLGDTLKNVGAGVYMVALDADLQTIIDVSRHAVTIPAGAAEALIDTVPFIAAHTPKDSIAVVNRAAPIELSVYDLDLDSGYIHFMEYGGTQYDSLAIPAPVDSGRGIKYYTFKIPVKKDGILLQYYFKVYKGATVYGYANETYKSYILPDTATLTKIEVVPTAGDTLRLPPDVDVAFTFNGYYSSKFIRDSLFDGRNVHWSLLNAGKSSLSTSAGATIDLHTDKGGVAGTATLVAWLDTVDRHIAAGVSDSVKIPFTVSANKLDSIVITRSDNAALSYLTTAVGEKAEFIVEGRDSSGVSVTITPLWEVNPISAGRMTGGVFTAADNFAGFVRISASVGYVTGVYNMQSGADINKTGLEVRYMITAKADTMTTGRGCSLIFSDSAVDPAARAEVEVAVPVLENRIELNTGAYALIGNAFDIDIRSKLIANLAFIRNPVITLDIPEAYRQQAFDTKSEFRVGIWDEDSLRWTLISDSRLDANNGIVSATVPHFSRYGILLKKDAGAPEFDLKPNPFSPFIKPRDGFGAQYGANLPSGMCISITPKSAVEVRIKLDVYTVIGDHVLFVDCGMLPSQVTYHIWWNGTTNVSTQSSLTNGPIKTNALVSYLLTGEKMCRNGRYYMVATISEGSKDKKFMKPFVLLK
jgi:hypothetical protein